VLNFFPSEALIAASLQQNLRLCCYLNLDFNVLSKARIMPTMTSNLNSRNRMSWHMVCFSFAFHGRIIAPLLSLSLSTAIINPGSHPRPDALICSPLPEQQHHHHHQKKKFWRITPSPSCCSCSALILRVFARPNPWRPCFHSSSWLLYIFSGRTEHPAPPPEGRRGPP
jgi:hypothetical protein